MTFHQLLHSARDLCSQPEGGKQRTRRIRGRSTYRTSHREQMLLARLSKRASVILVFVVCRSVIYTATCLHVRIDGIVPLRLNRTCFLRFWWNSVFRMKKGCVRRCFYLCRMLMHCNIKELLDLDKDRNRRAEFMRIQCITCIIQYIIFFPSDRSVTAIFLIDIRSLQILNVT